MKIILLMIISISLWANIGNIMAIKGDANIQRESSSIKATNGMILLKGDSINTSEKSRVQVMLIDETIVTIGASSSFDFLEYKFDGSKDSKVTMRANRGFFRSVTGKIAKVAPERFKVKTASATIGIRGTDFSGDVFEDRAVFRCYSGAIFVEFDGGFEDIKSGMMIEILKGKFEIHEFKPQENKEEFNRETKGFSTESTDEDKIPTEAISDVTQNIQTESEHPTHEHPEIRPPVDDPFTLMPNAENRQPQY